MCRSLLLVVAWSSALAARAQEMEFFGRSGALGVEPFGAEDPDAEDDVPRIPEPLVFDLVRSLGARQGEFEVNTLGIVNLRRIRRGDSRAPAIDWAPEAEYALWDNFAVELELPMEDDDVYAYKAAAQYTFGTALADTYIQGAQMIFEQVRNPSISELSLLYIGGMQFDDLWSALAMVGFRANMGQARPEDRAETLLNFSIFRHITDSATIGLETNHAATMEGEASLLIMPQWHWEITDHAMLQTGVGVQFVDAEAIPVGAFRGIYTF